MRILLAMAAAFAVAVETRAQSTAFTYQGLLEDAGAPADGLHDFLFSLFDTLNGEAEVGTICVNDVLVTDGKFTVTLDYTALVWSGAPRYLQVSVRADNAPACADPTGYTTLSPRQPITPTPLAIRAAACDNAILAAHSSTSSLAATANSLQPQDGSPVNAVFVDNAGNVGVGTTAPNFPLQIARDLDPVLAIQDIGPNPTQAGYVGFLNGSGAETGWMGFGSPGDPDLTILNARPSADIVLNALNGNVLLYGGNVGIGTTAPASRLEVRGDIRLGPGGQYRAAAGEENLRILRATLNASGSSVQGTGFSSGRVGTGSGYYFVAFTTPFASAPTVTVTAFNSLANGENGRHAMVTSVSSTAVQFQVRNNSGSLVDPAQVYVVAIGPR